MSRRPSWIRARYVCWKNCTGFTLAVGWNYWVLGIETTDWGGRVMLIWWHWCWHK